jgi:hypothetical protein
MLKNAGAKAKAVDTELSKAPAEEAVTVEVDNMSAEELDALINDQGITPPAEWTSWDVVDKRKWLNTTFGDAPTDKELKDEAASKKVAASEAEKSVDKTDDTPAEAPASKPKGKSKSKSKAVATSDVKSGEIVGENPLLDMVHDIENTKEQDAVAEIAKLMEETEVRSFRIGGLLSLVQANGWYQPFASFREFVETKYGIGYRKAIYWIEIYNRLSNSGIPWEKVKDLGWTKLQIIAVVLTPENVEEWVSVAKSQNTVTLIETVKNAKAKNAQQAITDESSKTVTTMSFKVHTDQKATIDAAIEKAKSQSGTAAGTVALEFICLDFLGGASLAERLKKAGPEAAFKAIEAAFPSYNVEVTMPEEEAA